jgi:hypothetical protein
MARKQRVVMPGFRADARITGDATMIDTENIVRGIAAHAKWKHYLRQAIATGESAWTVSGVRVDDQCEFGRWLRSIAPVDRRDGHWETVQTRHADFHREAARVLQLALARRQQEAEAAIGPGSPFAEASKRLTLAMTAWQKDTAVHVA